MDNQDIDRFFEESDLEEVVQRHERQPNVMWTFYADSFPVLIQTQENVNRMRIVVFIGDASSLERDQIFTLLEANYHTALDARYAITDDQVVSAFIHPFRELTLTQFISGLYQTIHCAETYGTEFSGGALVFGSSQRIQGGTSGIDGTVEEMMTAVVEKISNGN